MLFGLYDVLPTTRAEPSFVLESKMFGTLDVNRGNTKLWRRAVHGSGRCFFILVGVVTAIRISLELMDL